MLTEVNTHFALCYWHITLQVGWCILTSYRNSTSRSWLR